MFNYILSTPKYTPTTILILAIGVVHWMIPTHKLNRILFEIPENLETKEYAEVSEEFDTVFNMGNGDFKIF